MEQQHDGGSGSPSNDRTSGVVDTARESTGQVVEQAKDTASRVAYQLKGQASARLKNEFGQAAEGIHSTAEVLRSVGRELKSKKDVPVAPVAQYADRAADEIDRLSLYLRDKDLDQVVVDVERFARQQPATFIGAAFGLGLLAARFLKSSPEHRSSMVERSSRLSSSQQPGSFDRPGSSSQLGSMSPTSTGGTSPLGTASHASTGMTDRGSDLRQSA
jgi:hypothetical protein